MDRTVSRTTLEQKWRKDHCGFPMLWIESCETWVHWFPVTKLQFEIFLCHQRDPQIGGSSYSEMCSLNPRVAPQFLSEENYWRAFVTGILPQEAEAFARWCGPGYRVPTALEWLNVLKALSEGGPWKMDWEHLLEKVPPRRSLLIRNLDRVSQSIDGFRIGGQLLDQALMRNGVVEWVRSEEEPPSWGGLGEPPAQLAAQLSNLNLIDVIEPLAPHEQRIRYFGFRLLWSANREIPSIGAS